MAASLCSTALYSSQLMLWMHAGQPLVERQLQPLTNCSAFASSCGNSGCACTQQCVFQSVPKKLLCMPNSRWWTGTCSPSPAAVPLLAAAGTAAAPAPIWKLFKTTLRVPLLSSQEAAL